MAACRTTQEQRDRIVARGYADSYPRVAPKRHAGGGWRTHHHRWTRIDGYAAVDLTP